MREQVPNLRPADAVVRGGPHLDPPLVAPIDAVADDAVLGRPTAGGHVGLHGAGDARERRREFGNLAPGREVPQPRHHGHVFFTQGGNGQEDQGFGHGSEEPRVAGSHSSRKGLDLGWNLAEDHFLDPTC